jgi:hypothetical protein
LIPQRSQHPAAGIPIPAALAMRLQEVYAWLAPPATLADVAHALRSAAEEGEGLTWRDLIAPAPTTHLVQTPAGSYHTHCALDALLLPQLTGTPVEVRSACPHCGEVVVVRAEGARYVASSPAAVLSFGLARAGLGPHQAILCPFIHLFPTHEHYAQWASATSDAVTMALPVAAAAVLGAALTSRPAPAGDMAHHGREAG